MADHNTPPRAGEPSKHPGGLSPQEAERFIQRKRETRKREFEPPTLGASPMLAPVAAQKKLGPESIVTLVFRGGPPIVDKFDGRDYIVPPMPADVQPWEWQEITHTASHWQVEYQVAAHLQARAIVPGSRNPHTGKTASQIGILEVDPSERCEPFTPEQLQAFGLAEAIDRSAAELPSMRNVQVISTTQAVSAALAAGQNIDERLDEEPGADVKAPPTHHEGLAELQRDQAEFEAGGGKASRTTPSRGGRR
jgi:hypothetical protein